MARIPVSIADYVGRTPLLELTRIAPEGVRLFGKLESFNPGGSVKDRIGVAMIEAAEADGLIEPGRSTIVEATSGNTGIALAFVCAAKGYDLVLTLPQGMSREREGLLRLYGARVQITESLGGMNEAVDAARAMATNPDVFLPDQFSNPANPEAHRRTTGPELWEALDGKLDVLVCGVGTGGTITGAGEHLKARNPDLIVVAVEPAELGGAVGPHARPAQDPGHRRRLRPAGPQPRDHRRGDPRRRRGRDRDRAPRRPPRGRARRHLLRRGAGGGDRRRPARGVQGQADRRRAAGLRRALRLHAVLRPVGVRRARFPRKPGGSLAGFRREYALSMLGLGTLSRVVGEVRRDVAAAHARDPAARGAGSGEILTSWPGVQALLAHRVAHGLHTVGVPIVPRTLSMVSRTWTGIEIHPAARIGQGFFIDHGAGVVIGETAQIGNDVTLYQGVTLGGTGFQTGKRHPTLEDNVTVGAGAKLLGAITVGHGAKIGANTVVIHDVPPNSTVVGNPGHPVRVEGKRPEGPDTDWIHLPDPIADAITRLSARIAELEREVAELSGSERTVAEVHPLRPAHGPSPAGG